MTDLDPYWQGLDGSIRLYHGDCLDVMATLADASIDAVVTDPPYGLEFMSATWDTFRPTNARIRRPSDRDRQPGAAHNATTSLVARNAPEAYVAGHAYQDWCRLWAAECLRVLKPGGHLLAFGGPRTWHRLACGIEDAGFEIRDTITWLYGSGFPKSHDVSKAIDKLLGGEREVIGERPFASRRPRADHDTQGLTFADDSYVRPAGHSLTASATPEAKQWDGWGTALKPAGEPIIVARKPLVGTVAANVLEYGTGALHIDACRVDGGPRPARTNEVSASGLTGTGGASAYGSFAVRGSIAIGETTQGRWPANVVFSHAEGCRPGGTRAVRGNHRLNPTVQAARINVAKGAEGERARGARGHGNPDGTETVAAWACVAGCPVAELDAQSGVSGPDAYPGRRGADQDRRATYGAFSGQGNLEARKTDSGAASRFFPVFPAGDGGEPPRHAAGCRPVVASDSNGCVPGCPAAELDAQSGVTRSTSTYTCGTASRNQGVYSPGIGDAVGSASVHYGDAGTASRFFPAFRYEAKAGPDERPRLADGTAHPTVKPLELMKWLVRLVTPLSVDVSACSGCDRELRGACPGACPACGGTLTLVRRPGLVLDLFAGTGTTGRACAIEGMDAILIEQDEGHCQLAVLKLSKPVQQALFPDLGLA